MSIDALLAMILFVAIVAFVSLEPASQLPGTLPKVSVTQLVDDSISSMDSTGFIMASVESGQPEDINAKLRGILPDNIGFKIKMLKYTSSLDNPLSTCRTTSDFADCFPTEYPPGQPNPSTILETEEELPERKEIFHGRKMFIKKEPGDCGLAAGLTKKKVQEEITAMFLGNYPPEARDVNITTSGSCPGERNPCPETDSTMRCCYTYYDGDSNPEASNQFKWYLYDETASGDKWVLTGETGQTISLDEGYDANRLKCSVRVSDSTEWSQDTNSPLAIVGGPCFFFDSNVTQGGASATQIECGQTYKVDFSIAAQGGERTDPIDIMLTMDKSGSMAWNGRDETPTDTGISVFVDEANNTAYMGTPSRLYRFDVNSGTGALSYLSETSDVYEPLGLDVSGNYLIVADGDAGVTILNKNTLSVIRTIGGPSDPKEITTAKSVVVDGDYIYVAASGTASTVPSPIFDASMTGSQNNEERIGYSSSQSWAAQSFRPNITDINGVRVELRKYGSPNDLTVHLRSSITGADLTNGTATVSAASIPSGSYNQIDIDFPASVSVTAGQTYYLVLTTTSQSSSNYYRWGSRELNWSNPYSDGVMWRCTSGDSCEDRDRSGGWLSFYYEDARFRIYRYGFVVGGLVIIDKSDANTANWSITGSLYDTGSGVLDESTDIALSGDYAYITQGSGGSGPEGLWVIDISDKADPTMTGFVAATNPNAVSVSGNYAFVTDEGNGVRVVDVQNKSSPSISTTVGAIGTVDDIGISGNEAYVTSHTGAGATAYAVQVLDISDPPNTTPDRNYFAWFELAGSSQYALYVGQDYLFMPSDYQDALISMGRVLGHKMYTAREAAKEFVLYDDWESPTDKLGVASYANSASNLEHELVDADAANKITVNSAIDTMLAYGGTPMHLGLEEALDELLDSGRGRAEALKFVILLADGQSDSGSQGSIDTQVSRAQTNEVYIFTIGLGGDVDDTQLKNIAEGAYCPDLGEGDCGSYHHINEPGALNEVYQIIAQKIGDLTGRLTDSGASGIMMQFSGFQGMDLNNFSPDPDNLPWDGNSLSYENISLTNGWSGSFDATIPCDYNGCSTDFDANLQVNFPPIGTTVSFSVDGGSQSPFNWPEKFSTGNSFVYSDLSLDFLEGIFYGTEDTRLAYLISNLGFTDIDLSTIDPTINFHKNTEPTTACSGSIEGFENFSDTLEAAHGSEAGEPTSLEATTNLASSGYICIWLNEDQTTLQECSENNKVIIQCDIPETYVYVFDYWAWEK